MQKSLNTEISEYGKIETFFVVEGLAKEEYISGYHYGQSKGNP